LLILDQDSVPMPDAVQRMVQAFLSLEDGGVPVGAVGPALLDPATGRRHGFHQIDGLWWRRVHPKDGSPIRCDGLNGSGTLTDFALFERLGGLDAELFIDHVDTEWSFRLAANGWLMFGIPDAELEHRMGDSSKRVWLGKWTVWPIRSPLRHRYLFRNAVRLWFRPYVPRIWKVWVVPKLLLTALVYSILGPSRLSQLKAMARGVADGMRGNGGAI
jgi:rhamnosyltransferase